MRLTTACPLDVARCRKLLSICPKQAKIWPKIPGFEDDEVSDDSEEDALVQLAEARLTEIADILGPPDGNLSHVREFRPPKYNSSSSKTPRRRVDESDSPRSERSPVARGEPPCYFLSSIAAPLIADVLGSNGLRETDCLPSDKKWSVRWSGPGLRDSDYKELQDYQRINHFPGSGELTRKDRMFENVERMKHTFGAEDFEFVPESYTLPKQLVQFTRRFHLQGGWWIVKPINSSCGRGIFLLRNLRDLPPNQTLVVSKYVHNPLLIQGLKFDLRIYVVVTSYDPLRAYIYREGLVRFASRPYSLDKKFINDIFRHLTNYSVNKNATDFIENKDADDDDCGHKWSLSALNKHLRCSGIDVDLMWCRIMDLITKSLLAVEPCVSTKMRQVQANRNGCFEVYGFDVMVDEDLKPWLLEVNLSPSMVADSPLDWRVKSNLLSDAFTLIGIQSRGRRPPPGKKGKEENQRKEHNPLANSVNNLKAGQISKERKQSKGKPLDEGSLPQKLSLDSLSETDLKILARSFQEVGRCGNFVRLYPTKGAVARYQAIVEVQSTLVPRLQGVRLHYTPWVSLTQIIHYALFGPAYKASVASHSRQLQNRQLQGRPHSHPGSSRPHSRPDSKEAVKDGVDQEASTTDEGEDEDTQAVSAVKERSRARRSQTSLRRRGSRRSSSFSQAFTKPLVESLVESRNSSKQSVPAPAPAQAPAPAPVPDASESSETYDPPSTPSTAQALRGVERRAEELHALRQRLRAQSERKKERDNEFVHPSAEMLDMFRQRLRSRQEEIRSRSSLRSPQEEEPSKQLPADVPTTDENSPATAQRPATAQLAGGGLTWDPADFGACDDRARRVATPQTFPPPLKSFQSLGSLIASGRLSQGSHQTDNFPVLASSPRSASASVSSSSSLPSLLKQPALKPDSSHSSTKRSLAASMQPFTSTATAFKDTASAFRDAADEPPRPHMAPPRPWQRLAALPSSLNGTRGISAPSPPKHHLGSMEIDL